MIRLLTLVFFLCWSGSAWALIYYADITGGNDASAGTSTGTAWKHIPGMQTCAGVCASHAKVAGNTYILKGGETWPNANFPIVWKWNGTAANRYTIGVDQAWFTGASWTRPIWDLANAQIAGARNVVFSTFDFTGPNTSVNYVTLDNIEIKRWSWRTNYSFATCAVILAFGSTNITLDHLYIHDWDGAGIGECYLFQGDSNAPYLSGSIIQNSVVDGEEGGVPSNAGGNTSYGSASICWPSWKNNIIHGISDMVKPCGHGEISGNHLYNCKFPAGLTGEHGNMIETLASDGIFYIHDNVIHGTENDVAHSNECESMFIGNPGETDYVWNNIWYDLAGNPPEVTQNVTPGVAIYFWNNTVVPPAGGYCLRKGHSGNYVTIKMQNNHCITTASQADDPTLSATNKTISNNPVQTPTAATSQGYTASQSPYAYAPTDLTDWTVSAGTNLSTNCSGSLSTLCSDTSYGVGMDAGTHAVTGAVRPTIARPSPGAWDIGAYQLSGGPLTPPVTTHFRRRIQP